MAAKRAEKQQLMQILQEVGSADSQLCPPSLVRAVTLSCLLHQLLLSLSTAKQTIHTIRGQQADLAVHPLPCADELTGLRDASVCAALACRLAASITTAANAG
jgi:hypothetical protein